MGNRRRPFPAIKLIASTLCVTILTTQVLFAHSPEVNFWKERRAMAMPSAPLAAVFKPAVSPIPSILKKSLPASFISANSALLNALSTSYGSIHKVVVPQSPNPKKIVVHVQDIHRNDEAQKNIGAVIQNIADKTPSVLLALEGAFSRMDLAPIRTFPRKQSIKAVADYFLAEKKISGAMHTAWTSPTAISVVGVDDRAHYNANVAAYRASERLKEKAKAQLAEAERALANEKKTVFNPELAAFDEKVEGYRAGLLSLGEYAEICHREEAVGRRGDLINEIATGQKADPRNDNLGMFLQALRMEKALDLPKVESERGRLLVRLASVMTAAESQELLSAGTAFRLGSLRAADFYDYLSALCEKKNIPLSQFPAMNDYVRYVLLSDTIDSEKLFTELQALETAAYAELTKTSTEKALVGESKRLYLTRKLVEFSLTKEEWVEYKGVLSHQFSVLSKNLRTNSLRTENFEKFYEEAEIRDRKMAENLLRTNSLRTENSSGVSVLVTGGFHSQGIDQRLADAGYVVVTYVPQLTKLDSATGSEYLSIFTQEKTPLDKLLLGEKLFLSQLQELKPAVARLAMEGHALAVQSGGDAAIETPEGKLSASVRPDESVRSIKFTPKKSAALRHMLTTAASAALFFGLSNIAFAAPGPGLAANNETLFFFFIGLFTLIYFFSRFSGLLANYRGEQKESIETLLDFVEREIQGANRGALIEPSTALKTAISKLTNWNPETFSDREIARLEELARGIPDYQTQLREIKRLAAALSEKRDLSRRFPGSWTLIVFAALLIPGFFQPASVFAQRPRVVFEPMASDHQSVKDLKKEFPGLEISVEGNDVISTEDSAAVLGRALEIATKVMPVKNRSRTTLLRGVRIEGEDIYFIYETLGSFGNLTLSPPDPILNSDQIASKVFNEFYAEDMTPKNLALFDKYLVQGEGRRGMESAFTRLNQFIKDKNWRAIKTKNIKAAVEDDATLHRNQLCKLILMVYFEGVTDEDIGNSPELFFVHSVVTTGTVDEARLAAMVARVRGTPPLSRTMQILGAIVAASAVGGTAFWWLRKKRPIRRVVSALLVGAALWMSGPSNSIAQEPGKPAAAANDVQPGSGKTDITVGSFVDIAAEADKAGADGKKVLNVLSGVGFDPSNEQQSAVVSELIQIGGAEAEDLIEIATRLDRQVSIGESGMVNRGVPITTNPEPFRSKFFASFLEDARAIQKAGGQNIFRRLNQSGEASHVPIWNISVAAFKKDGLRGLEAHLTSRELMGAYARKLFAVVEHPNANVAFGRYHNMAEFFGKIGLDPSKTEDQRFFEETLLPLFKAAVVEPSTTKGSLSPQDIWLRYYTFDVLVKILLDTKRFDIRNPDHVEFVKKLAELGEWRRGDALQFLVYLEHGCQPLLEKMNDADTRAAFLDLMQRAKRKGVLFENTRMNISPSDLESPGIVGVGARRSLLRNRAQELVGDFFNDDPYQSLKKPQNRQKGEEFIDFLGELRRMGGPEKYKELTERHFGHPRLDLRSKAGQDQALSEAREIYKWTLAKAFGALVIVVGCLFWGYTILMRALGRNWWPPFEKRTASITVLFLAALLSAPMAAFAGEGQAAVMPLPDWFFPALYGAGALFILFVARGIYYTISIPRNIKRLAALVEKFEKKEDYLFSPEVFRLMHSLKRREKRMTIAAANDYMILVNRVLVHAARNSANKVAITSGMNSRRNIFGNAILFAALLGTPSMLLADDGNGGGPDFRMAYGFMVMILLWWAGWFFKSLVWPLIKFEKPKPPVEEKPAPSKKKRNGRRGRGDILDTTVSILITALALSIPGVLAAQDAAEKPTAPVAQQVASPQAQAPRFNELPPVRFSHETRWGKGEDAFQDLEHKFGKEGFTAYWQRGYYQLTITFSDSDATGAYIDSSSGKGSGLFDALVVKVNAAGKLDPKGTWKALRSQYDKKLDPTIQISETKPGQIVVSFPNPHHFEPYDPGLSVMAARKIGGFMGGVFHLNEKSVEVRSVEFTAFDKEEKEIGPAVPLEPQIAKAKAAIARLAARLPKKGEDDSGFQISRLYNLLDKFPEMAAIALDQIEGAVDTLDRISPALVEKRPHWVFKPREITLSLYITDPYSVTMQLGMNTQKLRVPLSELSKLKSFLVAACIPELEDIPFEQQKRWFENMRIEIPDAFDQQVHQRWDRLKAGWVKAALFDGAGAGLGLGAEDYNKGDAGFVAYRDMALGLTPVKEDHDPKLLKVMEEFLKTGSFPKAPPFPLSITKKIGILGALLAVVLAIGLFFRKQFIEIVLRRKIIKTMIMAGMLLVPLASVSKAVADDATPVAQVAVKNPTLERLKARLPNGGEYPSSFGVEGLEELTELKPDLAPKVFDQIEKAVETLDRISPDIIDTDLMIRTTELEFFDEAPNSMVVKFGGRGYFVRFSEMDVMKSLLIQETLNLRSLPDEQVISWFEHMGNEVPNQMWEGTKSIFDRMLGGSGYALTTRWFGLNTDVVDNGMGEFERYRDMALGLEFIDINHDPKLLSAMKELLATGKFPPAPPVVSLTKKIGIASAIVGLLAAMYFVMRKPLRSFSRRTGLIKGMVLASALLLPLGYASNAVADVAPNTAQLSSAVTEAARGDLQPARYASAMNTILPSGTLGANGGGIVSLSPEARSEITKTVSNNLSRVERLVGNHDLALGLVIETEADIATAVPTIAAAYRQMKEGNLYIPVTDNDDIAAQLEAAVAQAISKTKKPIRIWYERKHGGYSNGKFNMNWFIWKLQKRDPRIISSVYFAVSGEYVLSEQLYNALGGQLRLLELAALVNGVLQASIVERPTLIHTLDEFAAAAIKA